MRERDRPSRSPGLEQLHVVRRAGPARAVAAKGIERGEPIQILTSGPEDLAGKIALEARLSEEQECLFLWTRGSNAQVRRRGSEDHLGAWIPVSGGIPEGCGAVLVQNEVSVGLEFRHAIGGALSRGV